MMFHNTEKTNSSRKCTTSLIGHQNHNGEVGSSGVARLSPTRGRP